MGHLPVAVLELSLDTAEKELQYTHSKHAIELISKDEDLRRLRAELFVTEDDADELRDHLQHEQDSGERIRQLVDEHLVRAQDAEAVLETTEQELHAKDYEITRLQTENESLRSTTQDASTILAEKLSLARELSTLKPELDHLREQEKIAEHLRSEKLALQRQLSEAQCDIESARVEAKRAQAKRRNTTMEIAQEEQVSDLKKELARERRLRTNAEEAAEIVQADMKIDDIRKDLAKERKIREKLEQEIEQLRENNQLEEVRRELSKTQKAKHRLQDELDGLQTALEKEKEATERANKRAEGDTVVDTALNDLREQLKQEQESRLIAERAASKREEQLETEKTALEDKLNQFRTKLREKKEELATTKAELVTALDRAEKAEHSIKAPTPAQRVEHSVKATFAERTGLSVKTTLPGTAEHSVKTTPPTSKPATRRAAAKRSATITSSDAALGTPGDGPSKRNRQVKSVAIGEKSSFSITPFLNKTAVLNDDDDDDEAEEAVVEASPTADKKTTVTLTSPTAGKQATQLPSESLIVDKQATKVPLAPAASIKGNRQPRKAATTRSKKALSAVVEVEEPLSRPADQDNTKATKPADITEEKPAPKRKQKSRKSLTDFKTFQQDEEPVKQKRRRLGARAPTLFDEEEDAEDTAKSAFNRGLFGAAAYAKLAAAKRSTPGVRGSALGRSTLVTAADGSDFQFSPLKRSRKNFDDTLRG